MNEALPPQSLDASALATELAKLPHFDAPTPGQLSELQLALASAIASGQSADELAEALASEATFANPMSPASDRSLAIRPGNKSVPPANPAEWIARTVPLALAKSVATRIAVLDRAPTALGGLERPAWARAQKASAFFGPVHVGAPGVAAPAKFITVFNSTAMYTFVRAGVTLIVLPITTIRLSILHADRRIEAGSVWIAVAPIDASAPANTFAGFTMQSGSYSCDQTLSFASTTVDVPATATLSFTFVPAAESAPAPDFPISLTSPGQITVTFEPTGPATLTFDASAATVYGQSFSCSSNGLAPVFNSTLKVLYLGGQCDPPAFMPQPAAGTSLFLTGVAPIASGGWAVPTSVAASPSTLGAAAGPGGFAIAFGPGVSAKWIGIRRPEPAAGGFLLAESNNIFVELFSGSPAGVLVEQKFALWNDQGPGIPDPGKKTGKNTHRRCHLLVARAAGASLLYSLAGTSEALLLSAGLAALVDRPLAASGARFKAEFSAGIVGLFITPTSKTLLALSTTPVPTPTGALVTYAMALDNAILSVSGPSAVFIVAALDGGFNGSHGECLFLFDYVLRELFLPDPYTGALTSNGRDGNGQAGNVQGNLLYGVLVTAVTWTSPKDVLLRIYDRDHKGPASPTTTEAGSPPYPLGHPHTGLPTHLPPAPVPAPAERPLPSGDASPGTATEEIATRDVNTPTPYPLPYTQPGAVLLDLSTRASQLGVTVELPERLNSQFTIDGLSVRGPAALLPLTTLPAIAWEPMYNRSVPDPPDPQVDPETLLHPPSDGPFTQIATNSVTLIPISPLQSLRAVLDAGPGGFTAQMTMPFGMVAVLDDQTANGSVLPNLVLTQPDFAAGTTPSGAPYTGSWQVSLLAPDQTQSDPVLAGTTYLRTEVDDPASPALSYGEQVLGSNAAGIFSSRFDPPTGSDYGTGVPLRRYDLTGYGATTFSEWTNTTAKQTDVIKAFFHVLVGRTSHEVIQVQSVIHPHRIAAVRTINIDRRSSGSVERRDSGWQPASDGFYLYSDMDGVDPTQVHTGPVGGLINVRNIQQIGVPFSTMGTQDGTDGSSPVRQPISVQAVTFDADVVISPSHQVIKGGQTLKDLNGVSHTCVPATGITGYIGLKYDFHLSMNDMVQSPIRKGCGAAINATINVGGSNSISRVTEFSVTAVRDASTAGNPEGLIGKFGTFPTLSTDGSWSIAALPNGQDSPSPLDPGQAVPLIQPNAAGETFPGPQLHFADPQDVFRLDPTSPVPPDTFYGFLQATGTQSNFLSRPILTVGSQDLTLGDALSVAHAGALLGAISHFPGISQCLQFLASDLDPITNQLNSASLSTTQSLNLQPSVKNSTVPLISTSVANVGLNFKWADTDPNTADDVVISLGQPTSPSWSLDVNHIAVALQVPVLGTTPIMYLEGAFHADADSVPAFPNLKVVFDGALAPLTAFFTILMDIAAVLSPGGASAEAVGPEDDAGGGGAGLNVHFADGKLSVSDNFTLPALPLGPGTIDHVSLNIGSTLDIVGLSVDFLVGIGSPDAPCHWIVDPLAGTVCIQAGVVDNKLDVLIQGGIGAGLAIDLGIASGSASIVISVQIQVQGETITLMLLLTGQAQVDVLGGLASAAIQITAGLGFSLDLAKNSMDVIGTAQVGIHISICWVVNISWSGSWTFEKQLPLAKTLLSAV